MILFKCDLCEQVKDCLQKEIDGRQYDICGDCWKPIEEKLKGKGRKKERETVLLPAPTRVEPIEPEKPHPGEPPKIWGRVQ
jgi:hypothetical protein